MFAQFEGPEKKLEIILFSPQPGLRDNSGGKWTRVVKTSRAEIISHSSTAVMDAYLLSESSLFVWDDRILMITCGRTTLVQAVPAILDIVGEKNVAFAFYEQKNFLFPENQPSTFEQDVAGITKYFPGRYYKLGPVNYDHVNVFYSSHTRETTEIDATLQILMHDLDADALKPFCREYSQTPAQAEKQSGLDRLYSRSMTMDGYLFSPCGYSLNSIDGPDYFTVHVTPQPGSSYVSFETNIFETDYSDTISRVLSIFKPGRFSMVLTTSLYQSCVRSHDTVENANPEGYSAVDKSFYEFECGYSVTFVNYIKK